MVHFKNTIHRLKNFKLKVRLKILSLLLLFSSSYLLVMHFFVYENGNLYSIRIQETYKFGMRRMPESIDYLILGDSTCLYNISPKVLSTESHSACLVGGSLYLTKNVVNSLNFDNVKKGFIITQTFIDDHYDRDLWNLIIPNHLIHLSDVQKLSHLNPLSSTIKFVLSSIHLTETSLVDLSVRFKMLAFDFKNYRKFFSKKIKDENGHYAADSRHLNEDDFNRPLKNFSLGISPPPIERETLIYFLNEAQKRRLHIYFVRTPRFQNNLHEDYNQSVLEYLQTLKHPSLKILDYTSMDLKREDFLDVNHLNGKGAKKFSHKLKSDLASFSR